MNRLEAAFADLNDQGILTYPNHYCCGGCASYDIALKYKANPRPAVIGAIYFHEQSAERALDGGGLMLYYGALPDTTTGEQDRAIGDKLVAALRAHGLAPTWDGSPYSGIVLDSFDVELSEIPEGEESGLHDTYGATDGHEEEFEDY